MKILAVTSLGCDLAIVKYFSMLFNSIDFFLFYLNEKVHQVTAFDTSNGAKYLMEADINAKNLRVLRYLFSYYVV